MPRYFVPITIKEFKEKIDNSRDENGCHSENPAKLTEQIIRDLSKVEFDTENFGGDYGEWINCPKGLKNLSGYHTFENGFTFYACMAGGDWEQPLIFIIYWDGKALRGYIPTKGNTWNIDTKSAIGNNDIGDAKFMCKKLGIKYDDLEDHQDYFSSQYVKFDYELLVEDIRSRIPIKPIKPTKAIKSSDDIEETIKNTVFYGCGDESYELWSAMCNLCHQLYGLGQQDRAKIILQWIVDDAKASKEWTVNYWGSLDKVSSANGKWE